MPPLDLSTIIYNSTMMNNLHQHSLRLRFHKTVLPIKYEQTWYFPLEVFINTTNKSYTLSQWNFLNDFNFKQKYSHSFIQAFIQTSTREYTSLYGLNLFCYFLLLQLSTITGEAFIPPVVHFVIHLNLTLYFFMRFYCIILEYLILSPLTKILLLVSQGRSQNFELGGQFYCWLHMAVSSFNLWFCYLVVEFFFFFWWIITKLFLFQIF